MKPRKGESFWQPPYGGKVHILKDKTGIYGEHVYQDGMYHAANYDKEDAKKYVMEYGK